MDIFMQRELERAFVAGYQGRAYNGQPLTMGTGRNRRTIFLVSTPVTVGGRFAGLIGAFVDLQFLIDRLEKVSSGGLEAYVVDHDGRLVAAGTQNYSTGQDMTRFDIVKGFLDHTQNQVIATREFTAMIGKHEIDMLGTYNPVPALGWAVIAQKPQSLAYSSVIEMQRTAKWLALAVIAISVCISFLAARRITTPLDTLTESSRAIARGDFTQRVHLKSRTEFGELAETFNIMSADLERFVADLKRAADENLSLFLSSIQMIAGAVDEKDPYTRGHSDRVTRYSILLAKELGLPKEEIEKLRIAAQLHDVGKIGIEDRILKKPGKLTPEEFEIMKTHTTKGANILRPVEKLREMLPGIELHHESLDGRGYPHGLKGDEIPLMPRIIMVADTFDAMTTNRPYQTAMAPDFAVQTIEKLAKSKFDPKVVEALKAVFARGEVPDQRIATLVMAQATVPMDFDPQVETART
jgi:putative nucleotidyltransferase with HDIG domain